MVALKILKLLNEKPRLSPTLIASELKTSIQQVRNVLLVLSELKLVKTPSRGIYEVTELGKYVLNRYIESP